MSERASQRTTLLATCLGLFMAQLDTTVVNLALPAVGKDLGGEIGDLQWIVDAYNLTFASLLLTGGVLGDRFGRKPVFVVGLALFTAASLFCALASTLAMLTAGRALQGVGAAVELPGTLAILAAAFPDPHERARAIASWAGVLGLALALGPTAGAFMVDQLGWAAIFLLNVPIGLVTLVLAARALPSTGPNPKAGFDAAGQVAFALCLAALTAAAIESHAVGWRSPAVLGALGLSAGALVAFVAAEHRATRPIVPLLLFRDRGFATAIAVAGLMTFGMYGLLFIVSLYLQGVRGGSAFTAGLELLPMSLVFVVVSHVTGRLQARVGARWLMGAGMACMGTGLLVLAGVTPATGYAILGLVFLLIGIGLGLNAGPVMSTAVSRAPTEKAGAASGVANAARMVGATLGVAILGALLPAGAASQGADAGAFIAGMRSALTVGGLAILSGAVLAVVGLRPQ